MNTNLNFAEKQPNTEEKPGGTFCHLVCEHHVLVVKHSLPDGGFDSVNAAAALAAGGCKYQQRRYDAR